MLCIEIIFGVIILRFVPCKLAIDSLLIDTEIDWVAYMEQVEIYLSGERDYTKYIVSS